MAMGWLQKLKNHSVKHPIAILRLSSDNWESLLASKRGLNEFTVAREHTLVSNVIAHAVCLILGKGYQKEEIILGLISSKSAITTLESRISICRSFRISPQHISKLIALVDTSIYARIFSERIQSAEPVTLLPKKLSSYFIEKLATVQANEKGMRSISEYLPAQKLERGNAELQENAIHITLSTFGISKIDQKAVDLDFIEGKTTALSRFPIKEDSVIEHDARSIPKYCLAESDITGRALFKKGEERLEVFTANKRDLEYCFGVDLVYVNLTMNNMVMLQYKMLDSESEDWVYRLDQQLDIEIKRMNNFRGRSNPDLNEYRINPLAFFFKFVKRVPSYDGDIIISLDHFEKMKEESALVGPKNGLRLSYRELNGYYLRQTSFIELIRYGYIGTYSKDTANFKALITEILNGNKAVVAAIQRKTHA
jgi:hypothetical protein